MYVACTAQTTTSYTQVQQADTAISIARTSGQQPEPLTNLGIHHSGNRYMREEKEHNKKIKAAFPKRLYSRGRAAPIRTGRVQTAALILSRVAGLRVAIHRLAVTSSKVLFDVCLCLWTEFYW